MVFSRLLSAAVLAAPLVLCAADGAKPNESTGMARMAEAIVAKLPTEKVDRAAGFFGPVVKKYRPVVEDFRREYEVAPDKSAVIVKYMPQLEAALADAKAMKVPAKYEAEKADYIKTASAVVASLRFLCRFQGGARLRSSGE